MKILIVGSGGREHVLAWKLKQSKKVKQIFISPGNGGTVQLGKNIDISVDDFDSLLDFALKEKIDLTVVGPEAPLALGIVDLFAKKRLKIFGPTKKAAQLEGSKVFAKRFMKKFNIPTAGFKIFSDYPKAKKYLETCQFPQVLKTDGLAAGKGVIICQDLKEALKTLKAIMVEKKFGPAGNRIVIEKCLFGQEVSVICFTDGKTVLPLLAAQDHKPIFDGDQGPNTGGMGAYAPVPLVDSVLIDEVKETILQPTIEAMRQEGIPFKGILYAGLMLTDKGPKVLEFNCRFGDPETQPQLMLLKSDLSELMFACISGNLKNKKISFYPGYSVCVVLASKGYPESYQKGFEIKGLKNKTTKNLQVFHAGTKLEKGKIVTNGGRVLGITSRASTLKKAIKKAYLAVEKIKFKNKYYRTDIGAKAFIEVCYKITDPRAQVLKKQLAISGFKIKKVFIFDVYTIDKKLNRIDLEKTASMLVNPVIQKAGINQTKPPKGFDWALEIGFLPGVTDNAAGTAKESIEDLLKTKFTSGEGVYSSQIIFIQGKLSKKEIITLANSLINPLIQRVSIKNAVQFEKDKNIDQAVPQVRLDKKVKVDEVNLNVSDKELMVIGKQGIANSDGSRRGPLALGLTYLKAIQKYFKKLKRNPTDIELESIAQTWSEHCKHTIFADPIDDLKDGLFKTYIKSATEKINSDFCVSIFTDNSGAIEFDQDYLITDKVETHNSPSALDPFGGAITGIVGVNRDAIGFGLGAKPILNRYGFCFAEPDDQTVLYKGPDFTQKMLSSRRIMDGVIEGVNSGGNCSGIPTTQGFLFFDKRYRGKPLVFVGTVGLIPRKIGNKEAFKKKALSGDLIVVIGGRVGLDGIHGATFSSEAMDSGSPAGAVQIGDPITQKKLSDALVKEARHQNLYHSITDNGAGGLSCSVAEMAQESGGCQVELEKVPLKYPGLAPWQIWISESQERMTLSVPPDQWSKFKQLMDKHGVEAMVIGEFNNSGKCVVTYHQQIIMDIEMEFLHNGLPVRSMKTKKAIMNSVNLAFSEPSNYKRIILQLLAWPNITSFEFLSSQYDHEVQAGSVLKPLQGKGRVNADATAIKPLLGSPKAIVVSQGICPNFSDFDTYHMAAGAIDTAIRNVIAVGGDLKKLALLDNFCWCSADEPERLWQLKQAAKACHDYALIYKTPFISGKDSMFNDFKGFDGLGNQIKISVPPTLLISSLGVINNATKVVSLDIKFTGDLIYVLGETHDELTGSQYYDFLSQKEPKPIIGINLPRVNAYQNRQIYLTLYQCIQKDLIASAISVAKGGLAIALAKTCIAGMLGANVNLASVPGSASQNESVLFSESQGRILITIAPQNKTVFESLTKHIPKALIGEVVKKPTINITGENKVKLVNLNLLRAYRAYHQTFKDY